MENNEIMNDVAVVDSAEAIECGETTTSVKPTVVFAIGLGIGLAGKAVFRFTRDKIVVPVIDKIKGRRKGEPEEIDGVDYVEVDRVDVSRDDEE